MKNLAVSLDLQWNNIIQSTPTGSKLENAPKGELIKLLKRQQLLLKKSNTENGVTQSALKSTISSLESELESNQSSVSND